MRTTVRSDLWAYGRLGFIPPKLLWLSLGIARRTVLALLGGVFSASRISGGHRAVLLGSILLAACSGSDEPGPDPVFRPGPPGQPTIPPPPDLVIRPAGVQALSFETTAYTLPPAFTGTSTVHVGVADDGRILVGGAPGLFAVSATGTTAISARSITGLYESSVVGFLVATDEGTFVYDGTLLPSQLDEALEGATVRHFTPRGEALWFASDAALYLLDEGGLFAFDQMQGVTSLATYTGGDIAVATSTGGFSMLSDVAGGWQRLALKDEVALSALAPAMGGRIIGVSAGRLVERVVRARDDAIVWRRMSLVDAVMDPGAEDVAGLVADPAGAVWVLQPGVASRIDGDRIGTVALPAGFGAVIGARVTLDGALWLADDRTLIRIGSDEPPLSFAAQVQPYNEKNCARCHAPMLGISTLVLESAEDWRDNIDAIIEQVEAKTMPLDGMPLLGGDTQLPRRWLSGGMQP